MAQSGKGLHQLLQTLPPVAYAAAYGSAVSESSRTCSALKEVDNGGECAGDEAGGLSGFGHGRYVPPFIISRISKIGRCFLGVSCTARVRSVRNRGSIDIPQSNFPALARCPHAHSIVFTALNGFPVDDSLFQLLPSLCWPCMGRLHCGSRRRGRLAQTQPRAEREHTLFRLACARFTCARSHPGPQSKPRGCG